MGNQLAGADRDEPRDSKQGTIGSDRSVGPLLATLGLTAWAVVALVLRWIWAGYDPQADVLAIHLIGGGLAAVAVVIAGGATSVTLCVVGGLMSMARLRRSGRSDAAAIGGVVAALLGLAPIAAVIGRLMIG